MSQWGRFLCDIFLFGDRFVKNCVQKRKFIV